MASTVSDPKPLVPPKVRTWPWVLGFVLWCIAVFILSSIPGNRFPDAPFSSADKVVHSALFTLGAFLLTFGLRRATTWHGGFLFIISVVLMTICGVLDEFHQLYTPGRSGGDVGDMTADAVGAAIGAGFCLLVHRRRRPKPRHPAPIRRAIARPGPRGTVIRAPEG
ncbi:MAG: VanZ family protein [Terrimicrobiaceae bacterium]|nr:VanZ family protein [Terrimicrobiaceae bacterium]